MILEGALALLALMLMASALPRVEYMKIVFPANKDGNPILAFSVAMGYMLNNVAHIPVALGAVLGILVLEGFVVTTLDTAVRLCRYMLEEFWVYLFQGRRIAFLKNPFFNTALAVGLMLFFALNSTIMSAWKIFGAGNQLIAALAMTVVTVWLLQRGRSFLVHDHSGRFDDDHDVRDADHFHPKESRPGGKWAVDCAGAGAADARSGASSRARDWRDLRLGEKIHRRPARPANSCISLSDVEICKFQIPGFKLWTKHLKHGTWNLELVS